jgi:hypothetical protein
MNRRERNGFNTLDKHPSAQDNPVDTILVDVLTDLMHYCNHDSIDFDNCLEMARRHFEAED